MSAVVNHVLPAVADEPAAALLATVEEIARMFALGSLTESVEVSRRLLARPDSIAIAVLGSFKAGKSSFINTLADAPVLPVAAVPATAILTRVSGGPVLRAVVTLKTGEHLEIPAGELAAWVTEEQNPRNTKNVATVGVEAPQLARYPSVTFIDTPGLGSIFAHNSATSLAFLPRVEAAVLATSSTAPLSEADTKLLQRIADLTPRFALLLTKADLCEEKQRAEIRQFVVRQLQASHIEAPVYFWSQAPTFGMVREEFIRDFLAPLDQDASGASREIAGHRLHLLAGEAWALLATAAAAARHDTSVRDALRAKLDALCEGNVGLPALLSRLEREARNAVSIHMLSVLEAERPNISLALTSALEVETARWRGTVAQAGHAYEAWINAELRSRLRTATAQRQADLSKPLADFAANTEKLVSEFHAHLSEAVRETLGISLAPPAWQAEFSLPRQPDISVSVAFMFRLDWLWAVLPVALVRPLLLRHFRNRLPWEVEKNLSRAAAQCGAELSRRIHDLANAARQHVTLQRETMQRLLERGEDSLAAIEDACVRLEAARAAFERSSPNGHHEIETITQARR